MPVKFRCERDTLVEAVSTAQRAVTSRTGALPVLSGLLIRAERDGLEVVGSDLEITIRAAAPAEVVEDGVSVLDARLFADIVRAVEPGVVTVEGSDEGARVTSGPSEFTLRVLPADEFPVPSKPEAESVVVPGLPLARALRQVTPAASRDDTRPILTGVQLEAEGGGVRLVATDSYRLALRDLEGQQLVPEGAQVLVPAKALGELQRVLGAGEVTITIGERDAGFDLGTITITTRLIEGEFPNYRNLLPSGYPNRLTAAREPFIEAIKRVRLVAQSREGAPVRLSLSSERVEFTAHAQDVGEAHELVEAKYEGEEMTVAFNPEFLLDGVSVVDTDEVLLETLEPLKPATIRTAGADDGFLYLLMPVRVS